MSQSVLLSTSTTTAHHGLPAHEVVLLLDTDPRRGLADDEAAERLGRFGPNTLPAPAAAGLPERILRQFHHPLIYVLLAAGAITAGLHEFVDSAVIFGVVLINAAVGFFQESKAEAALESLRSMVCTSAKVVRGGRMGTRQRRRLAGGSHSGIDNFSSSRRGGCRQAAAESGFRRSLSVSRHATRRRSGRDRLGADPPQQRAPRSRRLPPKHRQAGLVVGQPGLSISGCHQQPHIDFGFMSFAAADEGWSSGGRRMRNYGRPKLEPGSRGSAGPAPGRTGNRRHAHACRPASP